MAIEIIRRKEGELSTKQEIRHQHTQFSINSYGHLCIREFDTPPINIGYSCLIGRENCAKDGITRACRDGNHVCEHYKEIGTSDEHLIVLDKKTTEGLINFIFENRSTHEFKELIKELIRKNKELPF
jgi:hypothetical protein